MGARGQKLVDAAFMRELSHGEQEKLQEQLQGSSELQERYRRLQLAERVVAVGPDQALDEPSQFEIDRMARRLGLLDVPTPARRFMPVWAWSLPLVLSAATALFVLAPDSHPSADDPGVLTARGQADGPTFSVYLVDGAGSFALQAEVIQAKPKAALMLRGTGASDADVWQAIWLDADGAATRLALGASVDPDGSLAKAVFVPEGARRLILLVGSAEAVAAFDPNLGSKAQPGLKAMRSFVVEGGGL